MSDEVTVRLTEDGPLRMRGNGDTWERGETREVSRERAQALSDAHDYVDVVDAAGSTPAPDEGGVPPKDVLEELTYDELYERAQDEDVAGRSEMDSDELRDALRED